jgi:hypothetical protein
MSTHVDDEGYQSPIVRFGMWFFGGLLILISPIVGYSVVTSIWEGRASMDWPTTTGKMTQASLEERKTNVTRGGVTEVEISYRPVLQYRYEVAGKGYLGSRLGPVTVYLKAKDEADAVVARYPVNADVKVYYDPQSAKDLVLEPGLTGGGYWSLIWPPAMLAIGILICWGARQLKKKADQRNRPTLPQPEVGPA